MNKKYLWICIFILITVVEYLLFVGAYYAQNKLLQLRVDSFDINNDGIFSEYEKTKEWEIAFSKHINDSGLVYIPIIAFPISVLLSLLLSTIIYIVYRLKNECKNIYAF